MAEAMAHDQVASQTVPAPPNAGDLELEMSPLSPHARPAAPTKCSGTHAITSRLMGRWGRFVSKHPLVCVALGLCVYAGCLPGLGQLKGDASFLFIPIDTNLENMVAPVHSRYKDNLNEGRKFFPPSVATVITQTSTSNGILNSEFWDLAQANELYILNDLDVSGVHFSNVCDTTGGKCLVQSIFQLVNMTMIDFNPNSTGAGEMLAEALGSDLRLLLQALVGNPTLPFPGKNASSADLGRWLETAQTVLSLYFLKPSAACTTFESGIVDYMEGTTFKGAQGPVQMTGFTSANFGPEGAKVLLSTIPLLFGTGALMVSYAVLMAGWQTRVPGKSQTTLVSIGVSVPLFGSIGAWGILGYMGCHLGPLSVSAPFVLIANGIDEVFVMLAALQSQGADKKDIEEIISGMMRMGGTAISVSSVTSIVTFIVGALASIGTVPFMISYNLNLVFAITLNWVGMLVLFPALVTLQERRHAQLPASSAGAERTADTHSFSSQVSTLVHRVEQTLAVPSKIIKHVTADLYPPFFKESRCFRTVAAMTFVALVLGSAPLVQRVGEGMPNRMLVTDNSYLAKFLSTIEASFHSRMVIDVELVLPDPHLEDPIYQQHLLNLVSSLEGRPDVAAVLCWPSLYLQNFMFPDENRTQVLTGLQNMLDSPIAATFLRDAVYTQDPFSVQAARCHVWHQQSDDYDSRHREAASLVSLAEAAGIPAFMYHMTFVTEVAFSEEIKGMVRTTLGYVVLGVFLILLLILPFHLALLASLGVLGVIVVMLGYMAITGITYNAVTLCVCVLVAGFCVDYFTHVCFFCVHEIEPGLTWRDRMEKSLQRCAHPVFQGAMVSCLAVLLISVFGGSAYFRLFGQLTAILTVVGGSFALCGLPSLLTVLDCCSDWCQASKRARKLEAPGECLEEGVRT